MSAIAGIILADGRPLPGEWVAAMVAVQAHRGNGPAGCHTEGSIGLGGRPFDPMPDRAPATASLPWRDAERDMAVTADARLDNRAELAAALGIAASSDARLILGAYQRWGDDCTTHLLGDFAFAIWDGRRRRLFCARDAFGLRPFVYHHRPGLFAFASETKGVLAAPGVPRRVDERRVLQHLGGDLDDRERTFYEGIRRLPAAHSLSFDERGVTLRRYWALDPSRTYGLRCDAEYAEAFGAIFEEAVRCRSYDVDAVGAALSGGLDSTSIACTARQLRDRHDSSLHTFSLVFDDVPASDERVYMEPATRGGGMTPHLVHGDQCGPLHDLDRVLQLHDGPLDAPNLFLHDAMYRAAAGAGLRVFLDGLDGDTTVSHGVLRLTELAATGRWRTLWYEAGVYVEPGVVTSRRVMLRHAMSPLVPKSVRRLRASSRPAARELGSLGEQLVPEFRQRVAFDEWAAERARHQPMPRTEKADHRRRLTAGVLSYAMEVAERASAARSLEARYPFFDRRLIEFCFALPPDQKLRDGWTRWILRRAMGGILPPEVQWRRGKGNLGPNFMHTLLAFDLERMRDTLTDSATHLAPYVRPEAARDALDRLVRERTWDAARLPMRLTTLTAWLTSLHAATH